MAEGQLALTTGIKWVLLSDRHHSHQMDTRTPAFFQRWSSFIHELNNIIIIASHAFYIAVMSKQHASDNQLSEMITVGIFICCLYSHRKIFRQCDLFSVLEESG